MSEFTVVPDEVCAAIAPLDGAGDELGTLNGRLGVHADAAAGTCAAGAMSDSIAAWSAALPAFSRSLDSLLAAGTSAAGSYRAADDAVGAGCRDGEPVA